MDIECFGTHTAAAHALANGRTLLLPLGDRDVMRVTPDVLVTSTNDARYELGCGTSVFAERRGDIVHTLQVVVATDLGGLDLEIDDAALPSLERALQTVADAWVGPAGAILAEIVVDECVSQWTVNRDAPDWGLALDGKDVFPHVEHGIAADALWAAGLVPQALHDRGSLLAVAQISTNPTVDQEAAVAAAMCAALAWFSRGARSLMLVAPWHPINAPAPDGAVLADAAAYVGVAQGTGMARYSSPSAETGARLDGRPATHDEVFWTLLGRTRARWPYHSAATTVRDGGTVRAGAPVSAVAPTPG